MRVEVLPTCWQNRGATPRWDLVGSLANLLLRIFRDIKSVSFLDIKSRYEIPAPLCGLVFVRFTPENFDAANAVLRMTYKGKCCANMDNFSVYKAMFAPNDNPTCHPERHEAERSAVEVLSACGQNRGALAPMGSCWESCCLFSIDFSRHQIRLFFRQQMSKRDPCAAFAAWFSFAPLPKTSTRLRRAQDDT